MQPVDRGLLVWTALIGVLFAISLAAIVIQRTSEEADLETRKIRFAAATFTGLLMLFIFCSVLYFADTEGSTRGKEIFEKAFTAMTPLAGAIVGYLFGAKQSAAASKAKGASAKGNLKSEAAGGTLGTGG